MPAVVAAARDVASDPRNADALDRLEKAGDKFDDAIDKIVEDSGLAPLASSDKLLDDLDQLLVPSFFLLLSSILFHILPVLSLSFLTVYQAASKRSDPEEIMQAAKDFVKHQPLFAEAARAQADGLGDKGNKIEDAVDKLGLFLRK